MCINYKPSSQSAQGLFCVNIQVREQLPMKYAVRKHDWSWKELVYDPYERSIDKIDVEKVMIKAFWGIH